MIEFEFVGFLIYIYQIKDNKIFDNFLILNVCLVTVLKNNYEKQFLKTKLFDFCIIKVCLET